MKKVYLVRHPRTKRNKNNKLTGWEKTIYSKSGREQAIKIKKFFKGKRLPAYSSDLWRALSLAKSISKENKTKLHISKLLRERNFKETKPKEFHETEKQFEKRIYSFFEKFPINKGIIITHAGVVRIILSKYKNRKKIQKFLESSRENILLIETNKKEEKLTQIELK
tara:strand:- start:398 stop:898 length:501 start_codon:yes stop_codon:yes gene_type:complete